MEVTVSQEHLSRALSSTSRVASAKAGLPVLANVLLRTDKTRLLIAATDLELASATFVGGSVVKQGQITVPAKLLSEFVANLPKGQVELKVTGTKLHVSSDGYSSHINGIDADEFPALPTIDESTAVQLTITSDEFKQAATQTTFACSSDVTRPVLTGVFWHTRDNRLYLAGTDGYRLAERQLFEVKSELAAIIPVSTIQEVLRVLTDTSEDLQVLFDETQVRFRVDTTEITSRLIEGKYPDYRQLLPTKNEVTIEVNLAEAVRTAKIARLFSRDTGGSITITTDDEQNTISIQSVASEVGENSSTIAAKVNGSSSVTLNSRYLTEALAAIEGSTLGVGFSGKLSPIVLSPAGKASNYTHIIMPLKS